jgi:hypothetical protein
VTISYCCAAHDEVDVAADEVVVVSCVVVVDCAVARVATVARRMLVNNMAW